MRKDEDLAHALTEIARDMGFRYFALTHHLDVKVAASPNVRLHNYPPDWVRYFDDNALGPSDPVHRATHMTSVGFPWSELSRLIPLSARDEDILERAAARGVGEGFTVPVHVPGEAHGSCSFATAHGQALDAGQFAAAQLVGAFAFEAARRIACMRRPLAERPMLTDRQRDCVLWAARGKSDWEIAQILGVSHETVIRHLKLARERYDVSRRSQLMAHALYDGAIGFADIFDR
nr:LuxR family transcriptional regulator [Allosphingosinicella indica]